MKVMVINPNLKKSKINKNIYGHFSEHLGRCIYEGLFVGEDSKIPNTKGMRNDVTSALKNIKIPVLRWPGGCFADEYHWQDGIGPKNQRKRMINTHWGGVVEDNSFGTHEFMELCEQLGTEPYINMNVGSGSVQEMNEWVEYLTFEGVSPMAALREKNGRKEPWKVKYIGVGNENWGCGGNMRPEFYADLYRRYQTYVRNYGDNKVCKIACGANSDDYNWTDEVMKNAHDKMDALSLHYYTVTETWQDKGSATKFDTDGYYKTVNKSLFMNTLIENHSRIMSRYDRENRVGIIVDEWGTWHNVESGTNPGFLYQQNTMRDAMVAAVSFNIFNRHSNRVVMANIAQTINVLQAVVLTDGEKMLLTPTYHVFDLYKNHHDATLIDSYAESEIIGTKSHPIPDLDMTASIDDNNVVHATVSNLSIEKEQEVSGQITDRDIKSISARILTGKMDSYNDFDQPSKVKIEEIKITSSGNTFNIKLPPCSVCEIIIE